MTTSKITKDAARYLGSHMRCQVVTNNIFIFDGWECDVFGVNPAGLTIEIEVKVSKSDMYADINNKKDKHYSTSNGRGAAEFYYAIPPELYPYVKERKPEYAGIITYNRNGYLVVRDRAGRLNHDKVDGDTWKKLAIKMYVKSI